MRLVAMIMRAIPSLFFGAVSAYLVLHGHPGFAFLSLVAAVVMFPNITYED